MQEMFQSVIEKINDKCDYYVQFALGWLNNLPGLVKLLVLLGVAFLIVLGTLSLIKKSFKLIIALGVIAAIVLLGWTFIS